MEKCVICDKEIDEIVDVKTKYIENEKIKIISRNLGFSPIYKISKRLECKSCSIVLYGLSMDDDSENDPLLSCFPKSLTLPEGRLKAVAESQKMNMVTVTV